MKKLQTSPEIDWTWGVGLALALVLAVPAMAEGYEKKDRPKHTSEPLAIVVPAVWADSQGVIHFAPEIDARKCTVAGEREACKAACGSRGIARCSVETVGGVMTTLCVCRTLDPNLQV